MSLDDYNYYNDSRTRAGRQSKWYDSFDESAMTVQICLEDEEGDEFFETLPVKFEVCPTCDGRGSHVNPSIDSGGLCSDDFHDDPDFEEEYFSGRYDVNCYECGGKRVVPVVNDNNLTDDHRRIIADLEERARWEAEYEAEVAMEIRMGC
jgi:hypothetical protein